MSLGERLRKARAHANLTQKQLEAKSGVSQKTISKIERGDQDASTQVVQLASACGVNSAWLATGKGEMAPQIADVVREAPSPSYEALPAEAQEIARVWLKLPPERREWFRDLMSLEAIVATHYPWLTFGRPRRESYDEYERRVERDILRLAAKLQGANK